MKKKTAASSRSSKAKTPKTAPRIGKKTVSMGIRSEAATPRIDDTLFQQFIEDSSDAFSLIDAEGKILYRSPSAKNITGFSDADILSRNMFDRIWSEDRQDARRIFAEIYKSPGKSIPFRIRVLDRNGNPRWVAGVGINRLADSKIRGLVLHYRDITEVQQAADALKESERRYRGLFENARLAIFQSTPEGKAIRVNHEFARMFGYLSPEDVLQSVRDVAADLFVDPARRQEILRLREKDPTLSTFENLYRRKDGSNFWGRLNIRSVTDALGKVLYLEGFIEDVTRNRTMEDALRESEEKYRQLVEQAGDGILLLDPDANFIFVNSALCNMLGYTREEMLSMNILDTYPEDLREEGRRRTNLIRAGQALKFESPIRRKDGTLILVEGNARRLEDGNMQGIMHDITNRKQSEEALRESEERYRSLFENSLEGIGLSQGNRVVDANKALLDIFGYDSLAEFTAVPLLDHVAPGSRGLIQEYMEKDQRGEPHEKRWSYQIIRKNGAVRDLEISVEHVTIGKGKYTQSTFRDITDRKLSEEALREKEERFRATFENANVGVCIVGLDGRLLQVNHQMCAIFGYGREELEQMTVNSIAHPEDTEISPTFIRRAVSGEAEQTGFDKRYIHKDGHVVWGHVSSSLVRDSQGRPLYFISHVQDITERKQAEEALRESEEKYRSLFANSLEGMGLSKGNRILDANKATLEIFGYESLEEFAAKPVLDHVAPESQTLIRGFMEEVQKGESHENRFTFKIVRKNGETRDVEISVAHLKLGEEIYTQVTFRDITERKRTEEYLARQTEEMRQRNLELTRLGRLTERRLQHLAAMRTVDMAISGSYKSELVMNILLEQITSQLNVHAADILLFHPAMQGFRFFCGRGFYSTPSTSEYLRLAESYAGRATQERSIVEVPRLDEKADGPKILPKIAKEGFVAYFCIPLIAKGQIKGVMELYHRDVLELTQEEDSFLETLAGQAAIAVDNIEMFEHLQSSRDELQLAFNSTLTGWARALEVRSREPEGETQRGADLAMRLAQMMGESENDVTQIYRGAILHDVGMIAVPDGILLKPGPLTDEEWTIVRRHPQIAFDILSPVLFLHPAADVPHSHHEKWDGSGYPRGLKGDHIPLPGRIFAVVDVWNALHSDRPYRKAWKDEDASEYIRNQAGKQFDPAVVQTFFQSIAGH